MYRTLRICIVMLSMTLALLTTANAQESTPSVEQALLEISDLTSSGSEAAISLDLAALDAMDTREIATSTIWTSGVNRFEGVPITTLMENLSAEATVIRASAINDYSVEISLTEPLIEDAILAFRMNGEPMSRRGKGPLWLIYPFDESSRFRTEAIYARSVWQLNRIQVIE